MATYKTPGVYVEEISLFPPSIAEVATAVPAFLGYTEKAVNNGQSLHNKPTRIVSFLEYKLYFGENDSPPVIVATVDATKGCEVTFEEVDRFYLYESLRLFFDNGGGACYIVSVGSFEDGKNAKQDDFHVGLVELKKYDEPTMIVMPDAVRLVDIIPANPPLTTSPSLDASKLYSLYDEARIQCRVLQDRVALMDLPNLDPEKNFGLSHRADNFRNGTSINDLKYGAAYMPWLMTSYDREIPFDLVSSLDYGSNATPKLQQLLALGPTPADPANPDKDPAYKQFKDLVTKLMGGAAAGSGDEDQAAVYATVNGFFPGDTPINPGISGLPEKLAQRFTDLLGTLNTSIQPLDPVAQHLSDTDAALTGIAPIDQDAIDQALGEATSAQTALDAFATYLGAQVPQAVVDAQTAVDAVISTIGNGSLAPGGDIAPARTAITAALRAVDTARNALTQARLNTLIAFMRLVANSVTEWHGDAKIKSAELRAKIETLAAEKLRPAVDRLVALEKNAEVLVLLHGNLGAGETHADRNNAVNAAYQNYDPLAGTWITQKPDRTDENPLSFAVDEHGVIQAAYQQAIHIGEHLNPICLYAGYSLNEFVKSVIAAADAAASSSQPANTQTTLSDDEKKRLQETLYSLYPNFGTIVRQLKQKLSEMPPCGAIAGIYAYVDNTRGVWKAPANVGLSQILGPVEIIDDATQEGLNVDVNSGKSINAIRAFTGRGTLVWGARTLAGNDNEWRYVSVRRFFNMVEESVKKSTAWAVFEPNDASLWVRVKGMIENYLLLKWRDGALAGAKPADAFFVKVGLGQTMTAIDILEGRLIIEIGMAVVRPAEFIILKFSHLMQKS